MYFPKSGSTASGNSVDQKDEAAKSITLAHDELHKGLLNLFGGSGKHL